jgi:hypothetical protein
MMYMTYVEPMQLRRDDGNAKADLLRFSDSERNLKYNLQNHSDPLAYQLRIPSSQ